MIKIAKLTRQSGESVFVNLDNVNFITQIEHLGQTLTEVNFSGGNDQSLLVADSIEDVELWFTGKRSYTFGEENKQLKVT